LINDIPLSLEFLFDEEMDVIFTFYNLTAYNILAIFIIPSISIDNDTEILLLGGIFKLLLSKNTLKMSK